MDYSTLLLIALLHGIIFGVASYVIGRTSEIGGIKGAILGFFLGTIGLIIVLCSHSKEPCTFEGQLQTYERLYRNGCITENEYHHLKARLLLRHSTEII